MWRAVTEILASLEKQLGIDASLNVETRARARIIYATGLIFIAVQIINLVSLYSIHGQWTSQHLIPIVACLFALGMTGLLRVTKSGTVFGLAYGVAALIAIGLAAMISSVPALPPPGINTALLPVLCGVSALIAFVGARWTAIAYIVASLGLVAVLLNVTLSYGGDAASTIIAWDRATQATIGLILVGPICIVIAHLLFSNLARLEQAVMRARAAESARAGFLAMMSHEIRTPLNGILGMSDMLAEADIPETEKRYAKLVQVSANSLMDIINEVLDMAKLEDGTVQIAHDPFSPAEVVQDVCDLFSIKATHEGLWLGPQTNGLPEMLIGDAPHLRQVLSNLVGNALKFTQEGGVRVGARLVAVKSGIALIQFFVQDTGVGIPEEEQSTIFERFSQTSSAKTTKDKGKGLGLSICRELTGMMGGELQLQSIPGQGTTFHFTLSLPMADREATRLSA
ncbi:MAG: ATP-binding protein [Pseudomonadota bacterium]